jgi:hypothetical protein
MQPIQQEYLDSSIGCVRRDLRSHGSGSENSHFPDDGHILDHYS